MRKYLLLLTVTLSPAALAADGTVVEDIIAQINADVITRSDLQHERNQMMAELQQQAPGQAQTLFAEREKDLLRNLIDERLLVQKGADLGINAEVELIKRLDEIRKSLNLETMEDLEKAAQQQGVSYEDFKQNLRNSIITQQVIGREVGSRIQFTQEELQKYYEEHKQQFSQPEHVRLSEILVATPAPEGQSPDPQQVEQAERKAKELLAEIRGGASFDEVARKSSEGPTAAQGGDLGTFQRGVLAAELEKLTFEMKVGDVSDVIRTRQGFIILKVTEHPAPGVPEMKTVEPRIMEALYYSKLQPALRAYLTKLREEAYIDIREGYVDTGASPNQTKPVYTTASVEEEKKKKKKKFLIF
ncbi:MAG TPA: peptidylprolyl isomerase [Terriglobales bacterium]|nr:peptidylprolyl isomerase [Terriglobales bacterium]